MHFLRTRHASFSISIFSGSFDLLLLVYTLFFLFGACYAVPIESVDVFKKDLKLDSVSPDIIATLHDRAESLEEPSNFGHSLQINDDTQNPSLDSVSRLQKRAKITSDYKMPGVLVCVAQMELFQKMTDIDLNLPWIFYTEYPMENEHAISWAAKHFHEELNPSKKNYKFIAWGRTFLNSWANAVESSMIRGMKNSQPSFPLKLQLLFPDRFLKNLARAYAREARGDIYLVVLDSINPDNSDEGWNVNTAWGGWELPTLTRKDTAVDNIYRVDPNKDSAPRLIWKQGQNQIGTPRGNLLPLSPAFNSDTGEAIGLN